MRSFDMQHFLSLFFFGVLLLHPQFTIRPTSAIIVQFAEEDSTVQVEEGEVIGFALLLSTTNQLSTSIEVPLALIDGEKATFAEEFNQQATLVTFEVGLNGDIVRTSPDVIIEADMKLEGAHTFAVTILPSVDYNIGSRNILTVVIMDTLDLQAFDFSFVPVEPSIEGIDSTVQICARANFDTLNGLDCSVVVQIEAIDGPKAVVTEDYSLPQTTLQYTFNTTTTSGDEVCLEFGILDDNNYEGNHSFTVSVSLPTSPPGITITTMSQDITIEDDDVVSIELMSPTLSREVTVEESERGEQVCVEIIPESPEGRLEKTITLVLNTKSDTGDAEAYVDYFPIKNRPIQFTPGDGSEVICVNITIFDDYHCEDDETFDVTLSSIDVDCVELNPVTSRISVIIIDDNSQPCNVPVNGGCPLTRDCLVVDQSRTCSGCRDELVRDPINPGGDCIKKAIEFSPGFPRVSRDTFLIKFFVNPDFDFVSALCRISGHEDMDCSTGMVQFENVLPRHCPYALTIKLEGVHNSSMSMKRKTKLYLVNDGVCVVNLVGQGIVVMGNEVTIYFQETESTSCGEYACKINSRIIIQPCGTTSQTGETKFITSLPSGEHQIEIRPACDFRKCNKKIETVFDIMIP